MSVTFLEETTGWPAANTIFAVDTIDLKVLPGKHPLLLQNSDAVEANWKREIAANPMLYDGRMVLQRRLSVTSGRISGEAHMVPFSTFLWWRKQADRAGAFHLFAYPVIASSDGALVAIKMGEHTANPGSVYFAAGSLDEHDVFEGKCDLESNMRREVAEETGLDLSDAIADGGYHAVHSNRAVTVFRVFRFRQTAEELAAAIERHMPDAEDQEIAGAIIIRSADPAAQPYHTSMPIILDWFFADAADRAALRS
jgi:8-oxo-dGTP pyrophosphatase MutT (NUDIX family)